ncbi:uncharacterized protein LOC143253256 [Tachypleus tridentatus]|uniref:uncharacterized protein LOC143253256 n=1 Tax=Tachypleus tridentatus TaxID=6853 RepID=UPI003FD07672
MPQGGLKVKTRIPESAKKKSKNKSRNQKSIPKGYNRGVKKAKTVPQGKLIKKTLEKEIRKNIETEIRAVATPGSTSVVKGNPSSKKRTQRKK